MRRGQAIVLLVVVASCSDGTRPPASPGVTPTTVRLEVTSGEVVLADVGESRQLRAVATLSDGATRDVTPEATWGTGDPAIARVAAGGLATAVGYGRTFYFATYQQRSSPTAGVQVIVPPARRVAVTGVVHDGQRPVSGAIVDVTRGDVDRSGVTDGNGFFDLGTGHGEVRLHVSGFGYDDGRFTVADVTATPRLDLSLTENPSPFIERTSIEQPTDVFVETTRRIVIRAGGTLDVLIEVLTCDYEAGGVSVELRVGSRSFFPERAGSCGVRVRAVLPDGTADLLLHARDLRPFRITLREPR